MAEKTLADLYKAKDITEGELVEVVAAYLKKPAEGARKIGSATQDIAAAIQAHPFSRDMMVDLDATEGQKRGAVRTAMLLGPVKVKG